MKPKKQSLKDTNINSREEIKNTLLDYLTYQSEPDNLLNNFNKCLNNYRNTDRPSKKLTEKLKEKIIEASPAVALEKHIPACRSVSESYQPLIVELCNQLIKEYHCHSTSEKALVEIIAIAFGKIIEYSHILQANIKPPSTISHDRNGFYSILSKEIDRSYRQYNLAFNILLQIKSPPLKVKINSKNTFISQNQEFNN